MIVESKRKYNRPVPIFTWLRKRIDPRVWAIKNFRTNEFTHLNPKHKILVHYETLRQIGVHRPLSSIKNKQFMMHCSGALDIHFTGNSQYKRPKNPKKPSVQQCLVCIDIDCHAKGTYQGALDFIHHLREHFFPTLFYSRSTNGKGIHAYLCIDHTNTGQEATEYGINNLYTFLQGLMKSRPWDIENVEVIGRPSKYVWGDGKYNLVDIKLGHTGRLPVDAFDRPEELMATTVLTLGQLSELGDKARRYWLADIPKPKQAAPAITKEFGSIDKDDLNQKFVPSMRNGEWVQWLEHMARTVLHEEDSVDVVAMEMANWLLYVELYDEGEKVEQTIELLKEYVSRKHNGCVTRILQGKESEVHSQIERVVKWVIDNHSAESGMIFLNLRQKRKNGRYARIINIAPLMSAEHTQEEEQNNRAISCSTLCVSVRTDPLPAKIEASITRFATENKMRRTNGEFPILRFARSFLRHLWDQKGSARVHRDSLAPLVGNNLNRMTEYKQALIDMGFVEVAGMYSTKRASNLYRLRDWTMKRFEAEMKTETKVG